MLVAEYAATIYEKENEKMKKILALLLALCMIFALAACGQQAAPAEQPAAEAPAAEAPAAEEPAAEEPAADEITLDVIICQYGPNTQEWFLGSGMNGTNFVDKFEAENPGIKLNLEVVSWNDVYTVVDTRIAAGNAPDILNIDVFANYATDGLLLPVSEYCPEELFNDFFPSFIAQSVIDDTVWAVPDLASARAMFYNVDMLNEVGVEVPTTWSELEDVSQAIIDFYNGEVYPWGVDMTTDEGQAAFAYYTWGNGGGFVDADGNWAVNSPENVEAIKFAVDLVNKGFTNPNPATQTRYDLQDMFAAGKMAMLIAPNQLPTYVADKGGTIKAIGKFLTFFYNPENYVGWVSMEGFLPAVNSAVEALVAADPSFEAWLDVLGGCQFYPTAKAEWDQVKQGVIAAEQAALTGADVQAELDALQAQLG